MLAQHLLCSSHKAPHDSFSDKHDHIPTSSSKAFHIQVYYLHSSFYTMDLRLTFISHTFHKGMSSVSKESSHKDCIFQDGISLNICEIHSLIFDCRSSHMNRKVKSSR